MSRGRLTPRILRPKPRWRRKLAELSPFLLDWDAERERLGYEPAPIDYTPLFDGAVDAEQEPVIVEPQWPALPPVVQPPRFAAMWLLCRILDRLATAWAVLVGLLCLVLIVSGQIGSRSAEVWRIGAVITFGPAFLLWVLAWVLRPPTGHER